MAASASNETLNNRAAVRGVPGVFEVCSTPAGKKNSITSIQRLFVRPVAQKEEWLWILLFSRRRDERTTPSYTHTQRQRQPRAEFMTQCDAAATSTSRTA